MLVLTRHVHQSIVIGHDVVVTVLEVRGDQVRLGITAPRDVQVHREEVFVALTAANRQAATSSTDLGVLSELVPGARPAAPPTSEAMPGASPRLAKPSRPPERVTGASSSPIPPPPGGAASMRPARGPSSVPPAGEPGPDRALRSPEATPGAEPSP